MIVPNPLCPQRKVVLMPGGSSDVLQRLAETRLLFRMERGNLSVETRHRGLFPYLFKDLWSQYELPLAC